MTTAAAAETPSLSPRRFLVTTPGLSATRWLSFVLASHPSVFVAHGKHPLDSIMRGQFNREKHLDDLESLTEGNRAADFYERESLGGIFNAYHQLKPEALAVGNVHTFTIESLMNKVRSEEELRQIEILNVLRHPVRYIASHTALVRSAESYPVHRHYAEVMFPQVVSEFPEVLLLDCEDFRSFLAFAVSCLSVRNLAADFAFPNFPSVRMELLTTDVVLLKSVCERLTGLEYSRAAIEAFIRAGAINQHRKAGCSGSATDVYARWATWQQDLSRLIIPSSVLDAFENHGYDVSMLRLEQVRSRTSKPAGGTDRYVPCLAECLRQQNPEHPLLLEKAEEWQAPAAATRAVEEAQPESPTLIRQNFHGFDIVEYRRHFYGLACRRGSFDLATATVAEVKRLQQTGLCFMESEYLDLLELIEQAASPVRPPTASPCRS